MKNTLLTTALSLLLLWPATAAAQLCTDVNPDALDAVSIVGGAVTATARTDVRSYREIVFVVDLVDASDDIDSMVITITNAQAETGGTTRVVGAGCDVAAGVLTCYPMRLKWDPKADGKNYEIPVPNAYDWITVTVTPTNHGAGDTVTLGIRGCV